MHEFYSLDPQAQAERLAGLVAKALQKWQLTPASLSLIKFRENAVFCATLANGTRYAVRVHRPGYHDDDELRSELQWMRALDEYGFEVPRVLPDRSGALFNTVSHPEVPEARQVDVFDWVNGRQLGSVEASNDDGTTAAEDLVRAFRIAGTLAAKLHNHASQWVLPPGFKRHAWDCDGLVGEQPFWGRFWELEALDEPQRKLVLAARDRLRADLAVLDRSSSSYGLIHADFAPENLLIDGDRVRLLDFDDAGFGWHMFEIATSLFFYRQHPSYRALQDALIAGYRDERALATGALAQLPMLTAARGFTYLGWVHTRRETETARELTPQLIEMACDAAQEYLGQ
ncbi:MAG: phosphotransferase [Steroidobacteraceae bacterium]